MINKGAALSVIAYVIRLTEYSRVIVQRREKQDAPEIHLWVNKLDKSDEIPCLFFYNKQMYLLVFVYVLFSFVFRICFSICQY